MELDRVALLSCWKRCDPWRQVEYHRRPGEDGEQRVNGQGLDGPDHWKWVRDVIWGYEPRGFFVYAVQFADYAYNWFRAHVYNN